MRRFVHYKHEEDTWNERLSEFENLISQNFVHSTRGVRVLPITAYKGRLVLKGNLFQASGISQVDVYERVGKSVI